MSAFFPFLLKFFWCLQRPTNIYLYMIRVMENKSFLLLAFYLYVLRLNLEQATDFIYRTLKQNMDLGCQFCALLSVRIFLVDLEKTYERNLYHSVNIGYIGYLYQDRSIHCAILSRTNITQVKMSPFNHTGRRLQTLNQYMSIFSFLPHACLWHWAIKEPELV